MRFLNSQKRGFTLAEIVIVIAIILMIAAAVLFNIGEARKKARDTQRMSDMDQIRLALRLYKEANGAYPEYDSGIKVGDTPPSALDVELAPYLPKVPFDPSNTGVFNYYYDSSRACQVVGAINYVVVNVHTMEDPAKGNWTSACTTSNVIVGASAGRTSASTYGFVLGPAN